MVADAFVMEFVLLTSSTRPETSFGDVVIASTVANAARKKVFMTVDVW